MNSALYLTSKYPNNYKQRNTTEVKLRHIPNEYNIFIEYFIEITNNAHYFQKQIEHSLKLMIYQDTKQISTNIKNP